MAQKPLTKRSRRDVVRQMKQRGGLQPARGELSGGVADFARRFVALFRKRHGQPVIATRPVICGEPPKCPQPMLAVADPLRDLHRLIPNSGEPGPRAAGHEQRRAKCCVQPHLVAVAVLGLRKIAGKRPFDARPAFIHQRQAHPQRNRRYGQCHADRWIAICRERPGQRAANVVDLSTVFREPLGAGARCGLGRRAGEQLR